MTGDTAERTMMIERRIGAPVAEVWAGWWNADTLPHGWGPEGFTCRTARIDLRPVGEWVFDMIGPDGTVYPNHHRYGDVLPMERFSHRLHGRENGPIHATALAGFANLGDNTRVTLAMTFASADECRQAKAFGAETPGLQTLGKLARFVGAD